MLVKEVIKVWEGGGELTQLKIGNYRDAAL